jgi:hypothetical protein
MISDEDISLAWSPMPPFESTGAGDSRPGGSAGIDFNCETRRAKWVRARFRYLAEQRRIFLNDILITLHPVHVVCQCDRCLDARHLRLLRDLDLEYAPEPETELRPAQKETVN